MSVMRRGRKKQPVLKKAGQFARRTGKLRVHGVPRGGCGRGVVRFVQHKQGAGPVLLKPIAQPLAVLLVAQKSVGHDEPGMRLPGVDAVAPFPPASDYVIAVQYDESQAKTNLHFPSAIG